MTFPLEFATLEVDPKPHTWLVLPDGFQSTARANRTSPRFDEPAYDLLERFIAIGLKEPRTQCVQREGLQAELCQRSLVFKFPDFITVQAISYDTQSALAIYSRSVKGSSDLGVNRRRVTRWLRHL